MSLVRAILVATLLVFGLSSAWLLAAPGEATARAGAVAEAHAPGGALFPTLAPSAHRGAARAPAPTAERERTAAACAAASIDDRRGHVATLLFTLLAFLIAWRR